MTVRDRIIIGVMGASACDAAVDALAADVGRLIAKRGAVLLCGGRGGVMEAAARGANEAGGLTIGILKDTHRKGCKVNPYIEIALRTGLGDARNWINVCAADALIAIAGGWGTLSEIALAKKINKPVVLLGSWKLQASPAVDPLPTADTAEQAVELAFSLIEPVDEA
ncbi:TIGR00725 family protein [Planctomycetales bacterium ZRK34]|nr:TIGR00725 family protein [Planctomycetales bacterium ZRK34]